MSIKIILTKEEWSSVQTWVESMSRREFERVSKERFIELEGIIKPFYLGLYYTHYNPDAHNIPHDSEQTLEIPRNYFRILVVSIGMIAYNFDVKLPTTKLAYQILTKLEAQADDEWKEKRY
jgi:hypothetical protein